jgi:hypothetical protein
MMGASDQQVRVAACTGTCAMMVAGWWWVHHVLAYLLEATLLRYQQVPVGARLLVVYDSWYRTKSKNHLLK